MIDAFEAMMMVRFEDAFFEEEDINWLKKEKNDYGFCVGVGEQNNLATKTIKILANTRNKK